MRMHNPPHPGRVLREYLGTRSVTDTAKHVGVTRVALSRILNGSAGISADMALKLADALGTSPELWTGMQTQYDLWRASQHRRKRLTPLFVGAERPPLRPPDDASEVLRKTVERIEAANIKYSRYFIERVRQAADIEGVASVFQRICERDDEMAVDHLMEIEYGLVFKHLGFHPWFEPTGAEGPDLMVERDGLSAFLEVKRYRPKEGEHIPEEFGPHGELQEYGNLRISSSRIANDLQDKLHQIRPRNGVKHGILAVWSDREWIEDVDFECGVRLMCQTLPEEELQGVLFCVFGSPIVKLGRRYGQRFFCEPVSRSDAFDSWVEDIQNCSTY